ncbi:class I SAM-dependent methyltransferase [Defluviimonas sp. WL0002]|uniref:Class I SAM-dependent methyltransferase n=1 Tax=Albidovulum marisflavi TaxID=2984159 RepID=A0ABT2Z950_9RHOB|nr:class I SAM-dependent methyltransferase [Defluviimonas sp. WL0002]MCV2867660.1 class I SAM-dependent methyltransferase [Defluviimonas sp. WL0002]
MSQSRLSLALDGADLPVEGTILVVGARADADLSALPKERVRIVQRFRPDHDALKARGFSVSPDLTDTHAAAVLFLPRSRSAARAIVASVMDHLAPGAPVWVDGQKTDGVDSALKDIRARSEVSDVMSKAHGKVFRFAAPTDQRFDDWRAAETEPAPGFVTLPGVFSADGIDKGSAALADALSADLHGVVADLGAGWGWLSAEILRRPAVRELHLIEADSSALDCARRNIADPRARFHWADAQAFQPERRFDVIVTNPPFHTERSADPALGVAFISAAARMLTPSGQLWLVANRHLPYEKAMAALFRDVEEVGGTTGFKVLKASRPVTSPRSKR